MRVSTINCKFWHIFFEEYFLCYFADTLRSNLRTLIVILLWCDFRDAMYSAIDNENHMPMHPSSYFTLQNKPPLQVVVSCLGYNNMVLLYFFGMHKKYFVIHNQKLTFFKIYNDYRSSFIWISYILHSKY